MNTTELLDIALAICPDRECMVFEGRRFSFAELNRRVNQLANALQRIGIQKGDHIGMMCVNRNEYIEAYFATAKLGGVFVPLNYRAKTEELSYMIDAARIRLLFIDQRYIPLLESIRAGLTHLAHVIPLDVGGADDYELFIAGECADEPPAGIDIGDEDTTILLFTSGTTGRPKIVPLRHDAFVNYVLENVEPASPEEHQERNILSVPLYHVAGIQAVFPAIYGGRCMILMRQFELREWLETAERERATRAMLVPTMLKWIVDCPDLDKYDLSSLEVITYGSAPMPFQVIRKAIERFPHVNFINGYGQTETAATLTVLGPEDHRLDGTEEENRRKLERLKHSIGKPLPDVQIRIVGENGEVLGSYETGEIQAKGPRIMKGYWSDEQNTARALTEDGWLRTGDAGYVDEDGYVYLTGRVDDLIIRGGENISPLEIEEVLERHPKVKECCVVGIPDPEFGQQPFAYCVLNEGMSATPEELIEFCRGQLASFKRPRGIMFIDELPRNSIGKVLRKELIKLANQTGKRYVCKTCNAEYLVTRGGDGTLVCCGQPMELKK